MKKKNNSARISEYKASDDRSRKPSCTCRLEGPCRRHSSRAWAAAASIAPPTPAAPSPACLHLPILPTSPLLTRVLNCHLQFSLCLQSDTAVYVGDRRKPWELDCQVDIAFPCATQVRSQTGLHATHQMLRFACKCSKPCQNFLQTAWQWRW